MNINISIEADVHLHNADCGEVLRRLDQIAEQIITQGNTMANEMEALTAEVERNTTIAGSVKALLVGLSAEIARLKNDPAKLQALADKLRTDNDDEAAAVAANTPAAETPPAPPAEPPVVEPGTVDGA